MPLQQFQPKILSLKPSSMAFSVGKVSAYLTFKLA